MGIFSALYKKNFIHRYDDDHIVHYFSYTDFPGMEESPVEFKTEQGITIRGHIYSYPGDHKDDLVIFCHGLGGGHRSYMREIERICREGYQVLAYDNVGCWESDGDDCRGMSESLNDLVSCLDYVYGSEELKDRGLHIIGHSWGGFAAGNILSFRTRNIRSVVVISGFVSLPVFVDVAFGGKLRLLKPLIMRFERKANPKYADSSSLDAMRDMEAKALLIHSKDDQMVPISAGLDYVLTRLSNPNITFKIVKGKFHNPNYTVDAVTYMQQTFGEFEALQKQGKLASLEDKQAYMNEKDFMRMTEQDEAIWKKVFAFMA